MTVRLLSIVNIIVDANIVPQCWQERNCGQLQNEIDKTQFKMVLFSSNVYILGVEHPLFNKLTDADSHLLELLTILQSL